MFADERFELRNERRIASERKLSLDPRLDRRQAQLLQPLDLDAGEGLKLQSGEGPTSPQLSRSTQLGGGPFSVAFLERSAAGGEQLLEYVEVEFARLDPQQIARWRREEALVAGGAKRLAEPRDLNT